jgi:hypothetical protein
MRSEAAAKTSSGPLTADRTRSWLDMATWHDVRVDVFIEYVFIE